MGEERKEEHSQRILLKNRLSCKWQLKILVAPVTQKNSASFLENVSKEAFATSVFEIISFFPFFQKVTDFFPWSMAASECSTNMHWSTGYGIKNGSLNAFHANIGIQPSCTASVCLKRAKSRSRKSPLARPICHILLYDISHLMHLILQATVQAGRTPEGQPGAQNQSTQKEVLSSGLQGLALFGVTSHQTWAIKFQQFIEFSSSLILEKCLVPIPRHQVNKKNIPSHLLHSSLLFHLLSSLPQQDRLHPSIFQSPS